MKSPSPKGPAAPAPRATAAATEGDGGNGASGGGNGASGGGGSTSTSTETGGGGAGGTTTTSTTSTTGTATVLDPSKDGPYTTTTIDDTIGAGNDQLAIHAVVPETGPEAGPYPVVVIAHGFQLPASQYYKYAQRLATFGYVALTVDFQTSLFGPDNPGNAAGPPRRPRLGRRPSSPQGLANTDLAGMTGHSLGGKLSLLAATLDNRVKRQHRPRPRRRRRRPRRGLQPPRLRRRLMPSCPTSTSRQASSARPPTPWADSSPAPPRPRTSSPSTPNAQSPSPRRHHQGRQPHELPRRRRELRLHLQLLQHGHAHNATVNGMSRAYVVAFYERHLRNNAGYDTYLTGAKAQELYVTPGTATIESK
jgi:hypothetical protein